MFLLIDINFYSGSAPASGFNPWLFLNSFFGVIGGFITAWIMFRLNRSYTKAREKEKEQQLRTQKLEYFRAFLNKIPIIFTSQEDSLRELVKDLEKDLHTVPHYGVVPFTTIERFIDNRNHEDFRQAFIGDSTGKDRMDKQDLFDKAYDEIHNKYHLFKSAIEAFDSAAVRLTKLDNDYQAKFEGLVKQFKQMQTDVKLITTHEQTLRNITKIASEFESPRGWEDPIKFYVTPLLKELTAEVRTIPKFSELFIQATDVKMIYGTIITRQEQNRDRLKKILIELKKTSLQELNELQNSIII